MLYHINALILGYTLNFTALFLNHEDGNKAGVALVVLSFALAYFSELAYVHGTNYPKIIAFMQHACVLSTTAAIVLWLF